MERTERTEVRLCKSGRVRPSAPPRIGNLAKSAGKDATKCQPRLERGSLLADEMDYGSEANHRADRAGEYEGSGNFANVRGVVRHGTSEIRTDPERGSARRTVTDRPSGRGHSDALTPWGSIGNPIATPSAPELHVAQLSCMTGPERFGYVQGASGPRPLEST